MLMVKSGIGKNQSFSKMGTAVILEPHDIDKLIKSITDTVREEMSKMKEEKRDRRMNMKQAAAFLNMHPLTLSRKLKSGEFPVKLMHVKGSSKYFLASELEAFLKKS